MKPYSKYDPEDIESLLLHKQFHELYPEEKEFILQHIETPEEYESLRKTLFELRDAAANDQWLLPDASLKKELMAQFVTEEKGGFRVWLNSLFTWPDVQWYRQPALRVAFAGACVAALVVMIVNLNDKTQSPAFADNKIKSSEIEAAPKESASEEKNLFAENIPQKELPAAPGIASVAPAQEIKSVHKESEVADAATDDFAPMEDFAEAPVPTMTDDVKSYSVEEKVASTDASSHKKDADNSNLGNTVTLAPASNSVATNKAISNVESVKFASSNSKPISEVNDLLNYLFTAQ